ncbi:MAG TPA: hypothetical protein VJJ23_05485 [Candidatus Nanoarchaeia archaeon]|nr:hypothetical protein [Candidatus Nanoarchaeia archaeon]
MSIKQTALIVGIAVLFAAFIYFTIDAFYPEPKYEDFCKNSPYPYGVEKPFPKIVNDSCSDYYSSPEAQQCQIDKGQPVPKQDARGCLVYDKCDYCNRDLTKAQEPYNRNVFIIMAVIGILAIIFGLYWNVDFLSGGALFGGILTLLIGTIRYFGNANKILRVIILLAEILILIFIGYKKVADRKKKQ